MFRSFSAMALLWVLEIGACVAASTVTMGDIELTIPAPNGFSPVTPDMVALSKALPAFVPPQNREFVSFIPATAASEALQNDVPDLPRRFSVQTVKGFESRLITRADFIELKNTIKTQNEALTKAVEKQVPGLLNQLNEGFRDSYALETKLSGINMVPMPPHLESDRMMAYASIVNYEFADENGQAASVATTATMSFAHLKGRLLFFYAFGEERDLAWTRDASQAWVDAIVAANPSDSGTALKESMPAPLSGIDWESVAVKAMFGALFGAVIGAVAFIRNRRKQR